jgi:FixJ family two-component response regulator
MLRKLLVAIVDDDESIRETTRDLIESAGLDAVAFESAEAFLAAQPPGGVSCPVADMRMAGMSGLALHEHLVASGGPIPTILMTAYPDEPVRARAATAGVIAFLAKPFSEGELLGCIGCAVDIL